jgi:hypothetical protein
MEWIYLALIALVLVFGIGVVVVNRRRSTELNQERTSEIVRPPRPAVDPRPQPGATGVLEPDLREPDLREPEVVEPEPQLVEPEPQLVEPEVVERPSFRSRMSKARSTFTGALLGIAGRTGITNDTWDDLEEALLRADVGVRVSDELLDGLRARVKSKEITEPGQLVDALRAEMVSRLQGAERGLTFEPGDADSPERVAVRGRQRRGQDHHHRQGRRAAGGEGRSVLMAAGDTFRAAAAEQLTTWAERSGAEIVRGRGRRPQRGHLRRHRAGQRPRHRPGAGRHRRPPAHQDQPHGRAAQGAPRRSQGRRVASPRCCSSSTPPPARTGSPRLASSAMPPRSPAWCSPSSTARRRVASCSPSRPSSASR